MNYSTGYAMLDSVLNLDGRPTGGLPSGHLVTFIEDDGFTPSDHLWEHLPAQVPESEGFVVWFDGMYQREPSKRSNLVLLRWQKREWEEFLGCMDTLLRTTTVRVIVIESARVFESSNEAGPVLRKIQELCARHDALGIFFTHESVDPVNGNTYWGVETPVKNYSSYVIGTGPRVLWSPVMNNSGNDAADAMAYALGSLKRENQS